MAAHKDDALLPAIFRYHPADGDPGTDFGKP